MDLADLMSKLVTIDWDWRKVEAEGIVTCLTGQPISIRSGRASYRLDGAEDVTLYFDGDHATLLEITLDSYRDPHLLSPLEFDEKVDEYFQKYQAAVRSTKHALGNPGFNNGCAAPGFPRDQEAVWLAQWPGLNARVMIQQKHEDKELPLRLCVVIAPAEC